MAEPILTLILACLILRERLIPFLMTFSLLAITGVVLVARARCAVDETSLFLGNGLILSGTSWALRQRLRPSHETAPGSYMAFRVFTDVESFLKEARKCNIRARPKTPEGTRQRRKRRRGGDSPTLGLSRTYGNVLVLAHRIRTDDKQ